MQTVAVNILSAFIAAVTLCGAADCWHFSTHDWRYEAHPNWDLLPHDECGVPDIQRAHNIFGGSEANIGQFPWMVGLLNPNYPVNRARIICGGSLINDRYVISAAHCSHAKYVVLGEHNQKTNIDCDDLHCSDPARRMRVEHVLDHPDYREVIVDYMNSKFKILINDISLLRLSKRITRFNEFVRPICLPTFTSLQGESFNGCQLETSGWGRTGPMDPTTSDILRWVHAQISEEECNGWNPYMETQICAKGDEGEDSCKGDSGGPLMTSFQPTPRRPYVTVLIGITSYGPPKDEHNFTACGNNVGVYTRVSPYVDWILDNIRY